VLCHLDGQADNRIPFSSQNIRSWVLFEVLRAVTMKIFVFWNVMPCSPAELCRNSRRSCCFHLQVKQIHEFVNWKCLRTEIILRTDVVRAITQAVVVSFSPRRTAFDVRGLHVGFVVGKISLKQGFIRVLISSSVTYSFSHYRHYINLAIDSAVKWSIFSRPDLKNGCSHTGETWTIRRQWMDTTGHRKKREQIN
jgi:hypothetical protein